MKSALSLFSTLAALAAFAPNTLAQSSPASPYQYRGFVRDLVVVDAAQSASETGRILQVYPAVAGKTRWNLDVDGPLVLGTQGSWTVLTVNSSVVTLKLWGAGGGAGGLDAGAEMAGEGGGAGYVTGQLTFAPRVTYTLRVGGGGGGGLTDVSGRGGGAGGFNGGGPGANAGPVGTSGGGGGGGGRTEVLLETTMLACAGGGGGGGGDGYVGINTNTAGNSLAGTNGTSFSGGLAPTPVTDGGGAGGGGGGCPGGAAVSAYPYRDSNGPGGAAGVNSVGQLSGAAAAVAGVARTAAGSTDADNGGAGAGGPAPSGHGAAGRIVIR